MVVNVLTFKTAMVHTSQNVKLLYLYSQIASEIKSSTTNRYPGSRAKYSLCTARRDLSTANGGIFFDVFGRYGITNIWSYREKLWE